MMMQESILGLIVKWKLCAFDCTNFEVLMSSALSHCFCLFISLFCVMKKEGEKYH